MVLRVVVVSLLVLWCAGCSGGATDDPEAVLVEGECRHPRIDTQSDTLDARCAILSVPEVRSIPENGSVHLPITVLTSRVVKNDDVPVLYLTGGPGGSTWYDGLRTGAGVVASYGRPVILYEQRGAILANPALECFSTLHNCYDEYRARGIRTDGYTLAESGRDVCSAIELLGYDQVALHGVSYGTALAQEVLRQCPERVYAAWLDGVVEVDRPWSSDLGGAFQASLDRVLLACQTDATCGAAYPDLSGAYVRVLERLPVEPTIDDLWGAAEFAYLLFGMLYDPEQIRIIPEVITRFDAGRYDEIFDVFDIVGRDVRRRGPATTLAYGMYFAVSCNEDLQYLDLAAVAAAHADLHPIVRDAFVSQIEADVDECMQWRRAARAPKSAVTADVPVLVTAGGFDPITPLAGAQRVAAKLPRSTMVTFGRSGHGLLYDGCAQDIWRAFLADPSRPPATGCVARERLDFIVAP